MTTEQLTLDIAPLVPAVGITLEERFQSFHEQNEWVYRALERMAADQIGRGFRRIGVKALFEVLRYTHGRTYGDVWKLNNSYTALYARALIAAHPEWADVIETRSRRSERAA